MLVYAAEPVLSRERVLTPEAEGLFQEGQTTSLSCLPAWGDVCLKRASSFSEGKCQRWSQWLMSPAEYQTFLTVTLAEPRHVWETLAGHASCRTHPFRARSVL